MFHFYCFYSIDIGRRDRNHLINKLKEIKPKLVKLINKGMLSLKDFDYPEINNCCEIIP